MSAGAWIVEHVVFTWWFIPSLLVALVTFAIVASEGLGPLVDSLFGVLFGGVAGAAVFFGGSAVWNLVLPHSDQTSRHELMVLRDQTSVSGSFVLGSGNIDGKPAFSFYTQRDGYNQFEVLKAPNARVYQDLQPGETPWMVTLDGCKLWGSIATCFMHSRVINEIHVPPNTIKPTF